MLEKIYTVCAIILLNLIAPQYGERNHQDSPCRYRFSYNFQMEIKGRILLFIPYRLYYEAGAEVKLKSQTTDTSTMDLAFDGIGSTGFVMSTGGLTGTSLWFFTGDYDQDKSHHFAREKINRFKKSYPYYAKKIKKIRLRPMTILSRSGQAIQFSRTPSGIHLNPQVSIKLTESHSRTYSNIYKILGKWLAAYNHSFLPESGIRQIIKFPRMVWYSVPLDFSEIFQATARLAAEDMEKRVKFRQKENLRLKYQVIKQNHARLTIRGENQSQVRIWKEIRLAKVIRTITVRMSSFMTLEDQILLEFRDDRQNGGKVLLRFWAH